MGSCANVTAPFDCSQLSGSCILLDVDECEEPLSGRLVVLKSLHSSPDIPVVVWLGAVEYDVDAHTGNTMRPCKCSFAKSHSVCMAESDP